MFGKVLQTDADISTANYGGPLVDIRGRVLGVIVPMAPQSAGEVAGAEWYDSGIGFAVPLASIADALERMKRGEDQHTGILGIGLAAKNPHSAPAELAVVRPDSPAGLAGLRGDRIVKVDGHDQDADGFAFTLRPHYGGEVCGWWRRGGRINGRSRRRKRRSARVRASCRRPTGVPPAATDEDAGRMVTQGGRVRRRSRWKERR
jgi:hypothetical protein